MRVQNARIRHDGARLIGHLFNAHLHLDLARDALTAAVISFEEISTERPDVDVLFYEIWEEIKRIRSALYADQVEVVGNDMEAWDIRSLMLRTGQALCCEEVNP